MSAPSLPDPNDLVMDLAGQLRDRLIERERRDPVMIGIRTGGVWIAEALSRLLAIEAPLGILDISFYRDDFSRLGIDPQVRPSELPVPIDDRHVILVDDVLHTGRTVRAALNEIFDYGRPSSVMLGVIVDRGGRELPIQPDAAGLTVELAPHEQVKLVAPEPLSLVRETRPET